MAVLLALLCCTVLFGGCKQSEGLTMPSHQPEETFAPNSAEMRMRTELRLAIPMSETSAAPYSVTSYKTQNILNLVYESPVALDAFGKPQPYLFETWEINADGTVTFSVRKNVRFHGGEALTCAHIAETLRKIRMDGAESMYSYVMDFVESWQLSTDALQITLIPLRGVYPMLMSLTFPVINSIDSTGTGPFALETFREGEGMRLVRSDNWWRIPPKIESISIRALKDDSAQIESLLSGEIDLVYTRDTGMSAYRSSRKLDLASVRSNTFEFVSLNLNNETFKNLRFKQAILHAIDKKDITANVYQGAAVISDTPVPADSWLHSGTAQADRFNLERSKSLLSDMGYSDRNADGYLDTSPQDSTPLTLKLVTNSDTNSALHLDAARRVERQLGEVGIKVEIHVLEMAGLMTVLESGDFDMAYLGCAVDAAPRLDDFFATGGALNFGGYSNPQMDSLVSQMLQAKTQPEFLSAVTQIEHLALSDSPIIGICYKNNSVLKRKDLSGLGALRSENIYTNIDEWTLGAEGDAGDDNG